MRLFILALSLLSLNAFATSIDQQVDAKMREFVGSCERLADQNNTMLDFTTRNTHVRHCLISKHKTVLRSTAANLTRRGATNRLPGIAERIQEIDSNSYYYFIGIAKVKANLRADLWGYYKN